MASLPIFCRIFSGNLPDVAGASAGTSAGIFGVGVDAVVVAVVAAVVVAVVAVEVRGWSPRTLTSSSPSKAAKFASLNTILRSCQFSLEQTFFHKVHPCRL